jgi:hypothetical protein
LQVVSDALTAPSLYQYVSLAVVTVGFGILLILRSQRRPLPLPAGSEAQSVAATVGKVASNTLARPARGGPFVVEALVSAGPRKLAAGDYERLGYASDLCEDGAGIISAGDQVFMWIADGASDGPSLMQRERAIAGATQGVELTFPILSSRILCQDLGRCFAEQLLIDHDEHGAFCDEAFCRGVATKVIALWDERFKRFLTQHAASLRQIAESLPSVENAGYLLQWSSTLILARLCQSPGSAVLDVANFGDCSGLVVDMDGRVEPCRKNGERIFMTCTVPGALGVESPYEFKLTLRPATEPRSFHDVTCFLFSSDGLAKGGAENLQKQLEGLIRNGRSPEQEVRDLARNYVGRQYDDKAILVGRRLAARGGSNAGTAA